MTVTPLHVINPFSSNFQAVFVKSNMYPVWPLPENLLFVQASIRPDFLKFEGAVIIRHMVNIFAANDLNCNNYTVNLRPTFIAALNGEPHALSRKQQLQVGLIAPCLGEMGGNLTVSEAYVVRGNVKMDFSGCVFFDINPLLARKRYPVVCPYHVNRLIISGQGSVKGVSDIWDYNLNVVGHHEVTVEVLCEESSMGLEIQLFVKPNDMPSELLQNFTPGAQVFFRGYLGSSLSEGKQLRVEVLSHGDVRRGY
ncbi:hypothetical protein PtA15_11A328 [Puccinia triticina]|uniref:Galectin n=1 Tax=Puccinia triticina TaxID=208348 RepID=A0ABY7CZ80_9BASI|nr:uncharacterized protein PtA15_11A328 [Puccinia triticina]WAQ89638.1 hypothetical protein PtA15_11A328 [Puccinia triticina]